MLTWLTSRITSRPIGLTRILVGIAAALKAVIVAPILFDLAEPGVLLTPWVDWLPPPSEGLAIAILAVWIPSALLLATGWLAGLWGTLVFACTSLTLLLDQQAYSNHLYLMTVIVLLLVIGDAGAGLSIRGTERPVVRWPVFLIMAQVSIVYGFSGLTKLNADFLSGKVLAGLLHGGVVPFPDALRTPQVMSVIAILAVITELFVALFLWRARFRPAAFVLGLALHTSITLLMAPTADLIVFSILMLSTYPLFLDDRPLILIWDDGCASCADWVARFRRFDLLDSLQVVGKTDSANPIDRLEVERALHLLHHEETTRGFAAVIRVLEHLVPTLWIAPLGRLPGIRSMGERWYRWQAARRTCAAGLARDPESAQ